MDTRKLSLLAVALAAAAFIGGCSRTERTADTAYGTEPAQPTPSEPATAPAPAGNAAGTNTAATDTTGTQPATTPPAPTTTAPPAPMTTADATTPFDDLDKNKDGGLSRDELPATSPLLQDFSTADKDGNGMLSQSEIDQQRGTMPPGG